MDIKMTSKYNTQSQGVTPSAAMLREAASTASPFLQAHQLQNQSTVEFSQSTHKAVHEKKVNKSRKNNDIRQLVKPSQVRLVNLDLDSPRMQQAMKKLGYSKEDLNNSKRKENFKSNGSNTVSPLASKMNLNTI